MLQILLFILMLGFIIIKKYDIICVISFYVVFWKLENIFNITGLIICRLFKTILKKGNGFDKLVFDD